MRPTTCLLTMLVIALTPLPRAAAQPSPLSPEVKEATKDVAAWVSLKSGFRFEFEKVSESLKPYVGKVIAMEGLVQAQQTGVRDYPDQPALIIEDRGKSTIFMLTFSFDKKLHDQVRMLSNGQRVILKGTLTERGVVKDATIVAAQENTAVRITAEELASEMDHNPLRLRRLLASKSLVLEGEIADFDPSGVGGWIKIVMPEKSGTKEKRTIQVRLLGFDIDPLKPVDLRIGQKVTIKGTFDARWISKEERYGYEIGLANYWLKFPEGTKFRKWQEVSKTPPDVLKVKLSDLAKEYAEDHAKAREKYSGRMVELSGKIELPGEKEKPLIDAPVVVMRLGAPFKTPILCHFKPVLAERVGKLKAEQEITIRGELELGTDSGVFNGDLIKD